MEEERVHSKLAQIAHICTRFDLSVHIVHTKAGVHTRGDLHSIGTANWRVQVRRKTRYVAETFRRRKGGEEWALEMERNIGRNGSPKPRRCGTFARLAI
jgi:hypothetical protein